jgi:acyl carrier protein
MNRQEVERRVIGNTAAQLGFDMDKIHLESHFVNDLGADSLDTVELMMEVEEEFDFYFAISEYEADKIYTVGQLIDCVCRKLEIR